MSGPFDDLVPQNGGGGTFDDLIPSSSGGVQDWQPDKSAQPQPTLMGRVNTGVNWLGTQITKGATQFAGQARGLSDLVEAGAQKLGVDPRTAKAMLMTNPLTAVGQYMPSTSRMDDAVFRGAGVPEVNLPGKLGHAVDVGVQTAVQVPAFPGSIARNLLPAFVGGAAQELAGQATEGTPWEIPARVGTGMVAGGITALGQNAAGNVLKGATNLVGANARNTDDQAARILGRALERDKTDFNALATAREQFPEGAPLVVAGGENVRGAVRGSTAAPGPARTTVADAAENYLIASDKRVGGAITKNVSDMPPISTRINTLEGEQSAAAREAYNTAGIPRRPQMISPERTVKFAMDEPPTTIPAEWNAPNFTSPRLEQLAQDSGPIKSAIASARSLSEYKHVPADSMIMWDQAYKQLGGMERAAVRSGDGHWAMKIGDERKNLLAAITEVNPRYARALKAYSEPQKLIDAATAGRDAFKKNIPPDEVKRVFASLPPDQQTEYLGGVAEFLRTQAGNSDRATAAERIWNNQNIRDRLQAILPEERYAAFAKAMDTDKTAAKALRGITQGSRTTPMALEAADNAELTTNVLAKLFHGRPMAAAMDVGNALTGRIAEGRTQAVNDRLAQWLMASDPQQIGLVRSLAERARLEEAARRSSRSNALITGAALPATAGVR